MKKFLFCCSTIFLFLYFCFSCTQTFMVFKRIITYFDIANAIVIEDIEGFFVPIFICCLGGLIISITSFVFLLLLLFKRTNFTHFVKCSYEEYKEARQKKKAEKEARKKAEKKADLEKQLQEIEKEL